MSKAPHVQAAFINALAEEGTREELVQYLQEQWNETCAAKSETQAAVAAALEAAAVKCLDLGQEFQRAGSPTAAAVLDIAVDRIRAMITDAQRDDLQAAIDAAVAKARAEDAAKINIAVKALTRLVNAPKMDHADICAEAIAQIGAKP